MADTHRARIATGATLEVEFPDGFEARYDFDYDAPDEDALIEVSADGGKVVVGFLKPDPDAADFDTDLDLTEPGAIGGRLYDFGGRSGPSDDPREAAREILDEFDGFFPEGRGARGLWAALVDSDFEDGLAAARVVKEVADPSLRTAGVAALVPADTTEAADFSICGESVEASFDTVARLLREGYRGDDADADFAVEMAEAGYEVGEALSPEDLEIDHFAAHWDDRRVLAGLVADLQERGAPIFPVQKYEHGGVEFSLSGTSVHADSWDTSDVGFYVPPKGVWDGLEKGENSPEEVRQYAKSALRTYTDWVNNNYYAMNVYSLSVERGEGGEPSLKFDDENCLGGILGIQNAEDDLHAAIVSELIQGRTEGADRVGELRKVAGDRTRDNGVRSAAVEGILDAGRLRIEDASDNTIRGLADGPAVADLSGLDLVGVDFQGRDVTGANFLGANLTSSKWRDATVRDVTFAAADLSRASFEGAHFGGSVDFSDACLESARLPEDAFEKAEIELEGADLTRTKVGREDLDPAAKMAM